MSATDVIKYEITVDSPEPVKPYLRRLRGSVPGAPAVVLLHGGNTSGDTYLWPNGGLAGYLADHRFDVWILEWRSSPHIVLPLLQRNALGGSVIEECRLMNLDVAVEQDLVGGLRVVRENIEQADLSVLGHCFGSAAVSLAVARGLLEPFDVGSIVLSTLGLFVETPWSGWIKAEDFIMERVLHNTPSCRSISPSTFDDWPTDMTVSYRRWPKVWLPSGSDDPRLLLERLAFMFGQPYSIDRLHESLRGDAVAQFFGPMHLGMFLHASQIVRRGYVDRFDAPDRLVSAGRAGRSPRQTTAESLDPTHFAGKRVTLLAAGDNHLWHRESIDLMYEWLRRNDGGVPDRYKKHVFPGYNLQELLWGTDAPADVFPTIKAALGRRWLRKRPSQRPAEREVAAVSLP
ncbi:MAG TPA: hypothetical protein VHE33_18710 [Acidobacteriaceae bacterium]|nr:hypothetical protein [Acidobacteriaceae bacterium]